MSPRTRSRTIAPSAVIARLALVAVLVAAAFAHRPHANPSGLSLVSLAQYVLPDGTLPDFCLTGTGDHQSHHHCEFCLIAGGSAPPDCPAQAPMPNVAKSTVTTPRIGPPTWPACLATSPPRGPPATRLV